MWRPTTSRDILSEFHVGICKVDNSPSIADDVSSRCRLDEVVCALECEARFLDVPVRISRGTHQRSTSTGQGSASLCQTDLQRGQPCPHEVIVHELTVKCTWLQP